MRCSNCENVFFIRKRSEREIERLRNRKERLKKKRAEQSKPVVVTDGPGDQSADSDSTVPEKVDDSGQVSEVYEAETGIDTILEKADEETTTTQEIKPDTKRDGSSIKQTPPDIPSVIAQIESLLKDNAPEEAETEKPAVETLATISPVAIEESEPEDKGDSSDLLAGFSPATIVDEEPGGEQSHVKEEQTAPLLSEPNVQDDIDAILASAQPATAEPSGQDDIDAILASAQPAPAEPSGQDDIDAILASAQPAPAEPSGQDDIDAILASAQPESAEASDGLVSQGDIDALLAGSGGDDNSISELVAQDDIDALLANAGEETDTESAPDQSEEKEEDDSGAISQGDLDALLAGGMEEEEKPGESSDDSGLVSQNDLDDLLAGFSEEESGETADQESDVSPSDIESGDDVISQDDIDALFGDDDEDEEDEDDPESDLISQDDIDALIVEAEERENEELLSGDDMEALATMDGESDEDDLDQLFESAEKENDAYDHDDTSMEFEHDPDQFESHPDDTLGQYDEIGPVEDKPESLVARIIAAIKKPVEGILQKIKLPALSKSIRRVIIGVAAVLVLASAGGGYWFFYGAGDGVAVQTPVEDPASEDTTAEGELADEEPIVDDALVAEDTEEVTGPVVKVAVYLPVEFDNEATRIMSVESELIFDSEEVATALRARSFFVAVSVENNIDDFFAGKFYEETIFAQDKLEEYLMEKLKVIPEFKGLQFVKVVDLTFED